MCRCERRLPPEPPRDSRPRAHRARSPRSRRTPSRATDSPSATPRPPLSPGTARRCTRLRLAASIAAEALEQGHQLPGEVLALGDEVGDAEAIEELDVALLGRGADEDQGAAVGEAGG